MKNILVLAFPGAQALDVAGPMEVFSEANNYSEVPEYRVICLGATPAPLQLGNGLPLATQHYSMWRGVVDTIVVTGGSEDALVAVREERGFMVWLQRRLKQSRRIVSVCTGAFVLAELGILDGRRVSTHWNACLRLAKLFPKTTVNADAIFTKDGNVYTSAGVTAGIDLALYLVEEDLGRDVCDRIARNLVLYLRRSGGQSQFSLPLRTQTQRDSRFEKVVQYIQSHLGADLGVMRLADLFAMSPRNYSRLFTEEMGESPARYVAKVRLDAVRAYLTETKMGLKTIAVRCGYSSSDVMGRAFRVSFGITPDQYRNGFGPR